MQDRRIHRLGYRFFRFTMKPVVRHVAVSAMVLGWALMLLAEQSVPAPQNGGITTSLAFIATLVGGFLSFMAMFAGISYWVAEPAARKIMAEHVKEGASSHRELVSREEWDRKHNELVEKINGLRSEVSALVVEVRSANMKRRA